MSQALGKVTGDLAAPRGPDLELSVAVEASWFGQTISVTVPRTLSCARCHGGGCDDCERAGAISVRGREEPETTLTVVLPETTDSTVCLRIPAEGGKRAGLPRGHLLLTVRKVSEASAQPGETLSSPQVALVAQTTGLSKQEERILVMRRSLIMAAGLILLFFGMLRLSGWL